MCQGRVMMATRITKAGHENAGRTSSGGALGFTLIELLVVCAIISILAAIAVPNFLDAQTRSKVARVKNDMRTMSLAIESYFTDNNKYPIRRSVGMPTTAPYLPELELRVRQLKVLTTPIAYITSLPTDIFESNLKPPLNVIE
jgi:prepilin-type N-terminal cleavage/methylation domain-containing protein